MEGEVGALYVFKKNGDLSVDQGMRGEELKRSM